MSKQTENVTIDNKTGSVVDVLTKRQNYIAGVLDVVSRSGNVTKKLIDYIRDADFNEVEAKAALEEMTSKLEERVEQGKISNGSANSYKSSQRAILLTAAGSDESKLLKYMPEEQRSGMRDLIVSEFEAYANQSEGVACFEFGNINQTATSIRKLAKGERPGQSSGPSKVSSYDLTAAYDRIVKAADRALKSDSDDLDLDSYIAQLNSIVKMAGKKAEELVQSDSDTQAAKKSASTRKVRAAIGLDEERAAA